MSAFALTREEPRICAASRWMVAGANGGGLMVRDRARYHEGGISSLCTSARLARVQAVFGIEMAGSATSRLASTSGILLTITSVLPDATLISLRRARVSAVRPG